MGTGVWEHVHCEYEMPWCRGEPTGFMPAFTGRRHLCCPERLTWRVPGVAGGFVVGHRSVGEVEPPHAHPPARKALGDLQRRRRQRPAERSA